jgi:hypothetical protein
MVKHGRARSCPISVRNDANTVNSLVCVRLSPNSTRYCRRKLLPHVLNHLGLIFLFPILPQRSEVSAPNGAVSSTANQPFAVSTLTSATTGPAFVALTLRNLVCAHTWLSKAVALAMERWRTRGHTHRFDVAQLEVSRTCTYALVNHGGVCHRLNHDGYFAGTKRIFQGSYVNERSWTARSARVNSSVVMASACADH